MSRFDRRNFLKAFVFSLGGASLAVQGVFDKEAQAEKLKEFEETLPLTFGFRTNKTGGTELIEIKTGEVIGGIKSVNWRIDAKGLMGIDMELVFHGTHRDILPWFRNV